LNVGDEMRLALANAQPRIMFYFLLLLHTSARVDFQLFFMSKRRRETDWMLRLRWGWL